jgi:hypothetical protein
MTASQSHRPPVIDTLPWYRQFWPWFIMALPAIAVVAALTSTYIAVKNRDSVARDNWYEDGKNINVDLARDQAAKQAKMSASLSFDKTTHDIDAIITGNIALSDTLTLTLTNATLADRDQTLTLHRQPNGHYHGSLLRDPVGRFYVELGDAEWRLESTSRFPRDTLTIDLAREQVAEQAGLSADLRFSETTGDVKLTAEQAQRADLQGPGDVDVIMQSKTPMQNPPDTLTLTLEHATQANLDQTLTLQHLPNGHYHGALLHELQGEFDVDLGNAQWRLDSTRSVHFPRESLRLEPN